MDLEEFMAAALRLQAYEKGPTQILCVWVGGEMCNADWDARLPVDVSCDKASDCAADKDACRHKWGLFQAFGSRYQHTGREGSAFTEVCNLLACQLCVLNYSLASMIEESTLMISFDHIQGTAYRKVDNLGEFSNHILVG